MEEEEEDGRVNLEKKDSRKIRRSICTRKLFTISLISLSVCVSYLRANSLDLKGNVENSRPPNFGGRFIHSLYI